MVQSGLASCVPEVHVSAFAREEFRGLEFSPLPAGKEGRLSASHIDGSPCANYQIENFKVFPPPGSVKSVWRRAAFDKQLDQCAISTTSDGEPQGIDGIATIRCHQWRFDV